MHRCTLLLALLASALALAQPVALATPEAPSRTARGELVVGQSIGGLAAGLALCGYLNCGDRAVPLAMALGAGAGAAEGALIFDRGVTDGQAAAVNAGTYYGLVDGLLVASAGEASSEGFGLLALAGTLAGTGGGIAVAHFASPTAGHVALADAGFLWSGVLTGLVLSATDVDGQTFSGLELGATNLGAAALALFGSQMEISRGRVLLIDAGGLVGGLTGLAIAYASSQDPGRGVYAACGSAGVVAGLATATFLTRNFDLPDAPQISVTPAGPRGTFGASLSMRF